MINLSTDKPAVFAEAFRVLRPGGRFGVTDVVAEDHLTPAQRAERGDYVGCIAGALSFAEYRDGLDAAGFTDIEITPTHAVADGMHSAIVRANKPITAEADAGASTSAGVGAGTANSADSCCGVSACCTRRPPWIHKHRPPRPRPPQAAAAGPADTTAVPQPVESRPRTQDKRLGRIVARANVA